MSKLICLSFFLVSLNMSFSQSRGSCKVINNELKGVYKGECDKGLANGKGTFIFLEGKFMYVGEFLDGKMHGEGEIFMIKKSKKTSMSKGKWENNVHVSNDNSKPYQVGNTANLDRYTIKKMDEGNQVSFNFFKNGGRNNVQNLNVTLSSGSPLAVGNEYGYDNVTFPLKCSIYYTTLSKLNTTSYEVRLELLITDPGEWEVNLYN